MAPRRSKTFIILVLTQLVSLMSLIFWGTLISFISRSGHTIASAGELFSFYPIIPLSLSIFSWIAFRLGRARMAVICSSIPAVLAFILMTYFYIVGSMQH